MSSYFARTAWTSAYACISSNASIRFSWMFNTFIIGGTSFVNCKEGKLTSLLWIINFNKRIAVIPLYSCQKKNLIHLWLNGWCWRQSRLYSFQWCNEYCITKEKGSGRKQVWPNLKYYSGICLEGLRKTIEHFHQDSHCPTQDANQGMF